MCIEDELREAGFGRLVGDTKLEVLRDHTKAINEQTDDIKKHRMKLTNGGSGAIDKAAKTLTDFIERVGRVEKLVIAVTTSCRDV